MSKLKVGLWNGRALAVIALFVAVVGTAVAVPLLMPDGTGNYSGIKQQVAKSAMTQVRRVSNGAPFQSYLSLHVDQVRPTTDEEAARWCPQERVSPNSDEAHYYTVRISERSFFGIETASVDLPACQIQP